MFVEIFNWLKPKPLFQRMEERIEQLNGELFEASLAQIQWKNSIESKKQQLQYIKSYLKGEV